MYCFFSVWQVTIQYCVLWIFTFHSLNIDQPSHYSLHLHISLYKKMPTRLMFMVKGWLCLLFLYLFSWNCPLQAENYKALSKICFSMLLSCSASSLQGPFLGLEFRGEICFMCGIILMFCIPLKLSILRSEVRSPEAEWNFLLLWPPPQSSCSAFSLSYPFPGVKCRVRTLSYI